MVSMAEKGQDPIYVNPSMEQKELLYEVTRQFASTLELDVVLGKVLSLTVQSVSASVGSIFLLDSTGRMVRSILARSSLPPEIKYPTVETVMNHGFAGWVYQQRRADLVTDTQSDERWYNFPGDTLVVRSAIAAPLIRQEQVIGVITLTHPDPHCFTPEQVDLLEAIASQATSAVEKAALHTRVTNERSMLSAIIAGVQDVILVTDLLDCLILANPAARRNLGLATAVQGRSIHDLIADPALSQFYVASRGAEQARREVALHDGRVFDCTLTRVPNVGNILSMHDVTTFKKLAALKNEFVSQVAHDLKAPLGIIYGYASLLGELPIIKEEEDVYVKPIINAILRMRSLINNILDIGRIEMGIEAEFQLVDMGPVAQVSVANIEALAQEKQISLNTQVSAAPLLVRGVPLRLEQAISNLVANAIKFTPEGGLVTVCVDQENGEVVVRVIDSGPGIPAPLQPMLFQKFSKLGQRATKKDEGHGLGLAIVKSVVDAHHGRVWVESTVGQGSVFAFALAPYNHAEKS
jgi:two-component system, OmpR family, phosphate regulon sensor histidine kinase PhoR